jgi:DNA repair protein RadA/Sms
MGKCPDCGEWNSLVEQDASAHVDDPHRPIIETTGAAVATALRDVHSEGPRRWNTNIPELDRVLGGGLVPGSAILIGGDPGIGKSTLLLQAGHALATSGRKTIYITSEESLGQMRLRAARLGAEDSPLLSAAVVHLDVIVNLIDKQRPEIVIIDSIQMVYRPESPAAPGSGVQLRDCAARLIFLAKQMGFALILVGHVTKEGSLAGPKLLEHLVDCVAYFEGDRFHSHRLLRAVKNRFGSTDELGIFEITDSGLISIPDPSQLFLQERRESRPGSVVLAACEGTRTLLVEIQALCLQSVFGAAKRKATGVDAGRLAMILAIIEKHADCVLGDQDVFVNAVGGVDVHEPAADLAIALAVMGAMTQRSLPRECVVFGELGLGGELRRVHHQRQRIAEAARVGFTGVLLPEADAKSRGKSADKIELVPCGTLAHAARRLA